MTDTTFDMYIIEPPVICGQCKAEGRTSRVYPGTGWETMAYYPPFYDEAGRYHHHDGNVVSRSYECSEGHQWRADDAPRHCPTCGDWWKAKSP